jgi:hypothetical protein
MVPGCRRLWPGLLLALALTALAGSASARAPRLEDSDDAVKKVIWMSGMQLEGSTGRQAEYITNSSTYRDAYVVALESARANAPSLQPVLVVQGHIDPEIISDFESLGALVVSHKLSFHDKIQEYTPDLVTGLWGSYLRVDIPSIMPKVRRLVDDQAIDTEYVLWTDPDVMFEADVNSSILGKPRFLAIGPDASPDNAENGGVIYYNVTGYTEIFDDLMRWSEEKKFNFRWVDQSMLVGYFNQGGLLRITPLPNVFNWKPYWGRPGNNIRYNRLPSIVLVHFHGPKLELAACVMSYFKEHNIGRYEATWWVRKKDHEKAVAQECGCRSKHVTCDLLFNLLSHAYSVDEGEFIFYLQDKVAHYAVLANGKLKRPIKTRARTRALAI